MNKYIDRALKMGATDAVPFKLEDICFDSRTLLKCMFGCSDWGKITPAPQDPTTPPLRNTSRCCQITQGIIIHTHDKRLSQDISLAIEGRLTETVITSPFRSATAACVQAAQLSIISPAATPRRQGHPFTAWA